MDTNQISLFSDDSTITVRCNDVNTYESDMTMILHLSQRILSPQLNTCANGKLLKQVESTKFLGMIIDKKLTWKPKIKHLISNKRRGLMSQCMLFMNYAIT